MGEWTAVYVLQAIFWVWLAREAARDRPRGGSQDDRSVSEWLWRYDASVIRLLSWTALTLSTIGFIIGLVAFATRR
jgi:hypothetical protein